MKKDSLKKIYLAAVTYAFITGFSFVFTKIALEYGNPINILAHRFFAAFTSLLLFLLITKTKKVFVLERFKKLTPIAITYPLLFFLFQTFGLQYASSSEGGILLAVAPVFTLVLATVFLKEKATPLQVGSIILSVSGVIFIFLMKTRGGDGAKGNILGVILLLLTTLCFSVYSILARRYTKTYKNIEILTVMITLAFVGFNLLAIFKNITSGGFQNYLLPLKNPQYLLAILYLGILSSLGTSMLTNYILTHLEASKMSVFANLGTLISMIAGVLVLNETVFYYHIIGAIFIVLGVIGTNLKGKEKG